MTKVSPAKMTRSTNKIERIRLIGIYREGLSNR
jgi:hypothetical protein